MKYPKVKLYAVEWTDNRPSVVSVEATLDGPSLYGIPQDSPHAFGLMTPLDEVARERLRVDAGRAHRDEVVWNSLTAQVRVFAELLVKKSD